MKSANILIFGGIGGYDGGVTAKSVMAQIKSARDEGAEHYNFYINSGGGDVFEAISIYNAIRELDSTVYIWGLAASAASLIAMAGRRVVATRLSYMMIHNPATLTWGDNKRIHKDADLLDKIKGTIMDAYRTRVKIDDDELARMMDDEVWMTAEEAHSKGFCDEIMEESLQFPANVINSVNQFVSGIFGKRIKNIILNEEINEMMFTDEELLQLRVKFGLPADADESAIRAAMLAKEDEPETPVEPEPETAPDNGKIHDLVASLTAKLSAIESKLTDSERKSAEQQAEALIDAAVNDGKILPADKAVWLSQAKSDYAGCKAILDKRSKNSTLPQGLQQPTQQPQPGAEQHYANAHNAAVDYLTARIKQEYGQRN